MAQNGAAGHGRLHNRIAIITGAASSIGRAIALAFAAEGAKVVVADLQPTSKAETESTPTHEAIKQKGGEASFTRVDVTDTASVNELVEGTVKTYGRLDIMVNNAGIVLEAPSPIHTITDEIWDKTLAVNASGVMRGIRAASQQMMKQDPLPDAVNGDRGWIINMASMFGLIGAPGAPAYTSAKHLTMGLTKASAIDLAAHSIHVNAICPGFVDTAMTSPMWADNSPIGGEGEPSNPMAAMSGPQRKALISSLHPFGGQGGRMGRPEDVAGVAVFLASSDSKWVTGAGIVTDGGFSIQ